MYQTITPEILGGWLVDRGRDDLPTPDDEDRRCRARRRPPNDKRCSQDAYYGVDFMCTNCGPRYSTSCIPCRIEGERTRYFCRICGHTPLTIVEWHLLK